MGNTSPYSLESDAHPKMQNIKVHLLKSGMVLDKITIGLLVVCLIIVILYLVFDKTKDSNKIEYPTTTFVPITTNRKKLYFS